MSGLIETLMRKVKLIEKYDDLDEKTALTIAGFRASQLGGNSILLVSDYIELYDLEDAAFYSWNSESELVSSEWGEKISRSCVLMAIIDRYGPLVFILRLR